MSSWLRLLLGLDDGEIPAGGVTRLEWTGLRGGWWTPAVVALIAAAIALVVLIYRRERELPIGRRLVLTALRLIALGAVAVVLLHPRLTVELQARREAQTLLLVDGSGSMCVRDLYTSEERQKIRRAAGVDPASFGHVAGQRAGQMDRAASRAELAAAAIEHAGLAEKLGRANRLRVFSFDEEISAVAPEKLAAALARASAQSRPTWIGSAVRGAIESARADPIAAVVLVSDGRSNGGDALAAAAVDLEARGIPLHAVAVGRVDVEKNLAVAELNVPEVAETGIPLRIRVRIRISGYPGDVEVRLWRLRVGERKAERVGQETVAAADGETESVVFMTDLPPRDGRYRYTAEVEAREGEVNRKDNSRSAETVVASEKCRLLLVSSGPSYLFQFLKTFLIRDAGLQVSCWLQNADPKAPQDGDLPLKKLPATDEELRPYDAVILLDPDPQALPDGFGAAIERFVSEGGGGLVFVAGQHHTPRLPQTGEGARIQALLPVELTARNVPKEHSRPWRPQLTAAGAAHTICQLRSRGEENRRLWETLPPFYFRYPVGALRPAARELWRSGESAAAAIHQPGAGQVVFFATPEMNRWREVQDGAVFEQFWSSTARFLALGKRLAGTRKVTISTDRERYQPGEEVRVEAHILDSGHKPLAQSRVEATLEHSKAEEESDDGKSAESSPSPSSDQNDKEGAAAGPSDRRELSLEAVAGRPGWFRGRWRAEGRGNYRVTLGGTGGEGVPAAFVVAEPTGESQDPRPDFPALAELARRSGGSFVPLWEILSVPARIPDRTVVEVLGRKTATVWDSAFLLFIFSGALILEWVLRKKWRLC